MEAEQDPIEDVDRRIETWLARIENVRDPLLRVSSIRSDLATMSPSSVARVVEDLALGADAGPRTYGVLLAFVAMALADDSLAAARAMAADVGRERGLFAAVELLVPESTEAVDVVPKIMSVRGRTLTHGERKSLARTRSRLWLEKVALDPSPDVIRIVLGNPALTEADVVRIAARRPIDPRLLREVFRAPRFAMRPLVRLALVKNPALETHLALVLVRLLTRPEAIDVAESRELAESVRDAARRASARPPMH